MFPILESSDMHIEVKRLIKQWEMDGSSRTIYRSLSQSQSNLLFNVFAIVSPVLYYNCSKNLKNNHSGLDQLHNAIMYKKKMRFIFSNKQLTQPSNVFIPILTVVSIFDRFFSKNF